MDICRSKLDGKVSFEQSNGELLKFVEFQEYFTHSKQSTFTHSRVARKRAWSMNGSGVEKTWLDIPRPCVKDWERHTFPFFPICHLLYCFFVSEFLTLCDILYTFLSALSHAKKLFLFR